MSSKKDKRKDNKDKKDKKKLKSGPKKTNDITPHFKVPLARYFYIENTTSTHTNKGQEVKWDSTHLKCSLSATELEDSLLLKNISQGHILTGKLWPLVFPHEYSPDTLAHFRSIPFFSQVVKDPSILKSLEHRHFVAFMVGVRDLWFTVSWKLSPPEDYESGKQLVDDMICLVEDDAFLSAEAQSMPFSLAPTQSRRILRFMDHLDVEDEEFKEYTAQLAIASNNSESQVHPLVFAVWVDPRDLSYHNFECILPLDRALSVPPEDSTKHPNFASNIALEKFEALDPSMKVFTAKLKGPDVKLLKKLDKLGLYQQPSNSTTRGGERFIFSSSFLSNGLTKAIGESDIKATLEAGEGEFVGVNYVFRCIKFAPGDSKFKLHMDTPYYDSLRSHISKYTLLIYLTSGKGKPALRIGGGEDGKTGSSVSIDRIHKMQCIIFDQRHEHEGSAFLKTAKVFLRSELIFKLNKKETHPEIAALFSSAVYLTTESTFQPELAQYANDIYECVNRAHWGVKYAPIPGPPLRHKCWRKRMHFVTNGWDYYFPYLGGDGKCPLLELKTCALIAVMDYVNCKLEIPAEDETQPKKKRKIKSSKVFRKDCATTQLHSQPTDENTTAWVLEYLWSSLHKRFKKQGPIIPPISKEAKAERLDSSVRQYPEFDVDGQDIKQTDGEGGEVADEEEYEDPNCCPSCCGDSFKPERHETVAIAFDTSMEYASRKLLGAPIVLLDNELHIDADNIEVEAGKIYINSANPTGKSIRVNFAACWGLNEYGGGGSIRICWRFQACNSTQASTTANKLRCNTRKQSRGQNRAFTSCLTSLRTIGLFQK